MPIRLFIMVWLVAGLQLSACTPALSTQSDVKDTPSHEPSTIYPIDELESITSSTKDNFPISPSFTPSPTIVTLSTSHAQPEITTTVIPPLAHEPIGAITPTMIVQTEIAVDVSTTTTTVPKGFEMWKINIIELDASQLLGPLAVALVSDSEGNSAILDFGTHTIYQMFNKPAQPVAWVDNGCGVIFESSDSKGTKIELLDIGTNELTELGRGQKFGSAITDQSGKWLVYALDTGENTVGFVNLNQDDYEFSIVGLENSIPLAINSGKSKLYIQYEESNGTKIGELSLLGKGEVQELVSVNSVLSVSADRNLQTRVAEVVDYGELGLFARLIAFERGPMNDAVVHQMGVVNLEDGTFTEVFNSENFNGVTYIDEGASWSPLTPKFVIAGFFARDTYGITDLIIVDGQTGERESIGLDAYQTEHPWLDSVFEPSWSPNGEMIIFQGWIQIAIYNIVKNELYPLEGIKGGGMRPNEQGFFWSPLLNYSLNPCR